MALKDQLFISGSWTDTDVQGQNTSGTPVVSAVKTGTGEEIADTYTLTVSARTGGTATVTVVASSSNPYTGRVKTGLAFDNSTVITDVIPGVSIVFDTAGANGNTAQIIIGSPYGAFDASGVDAGVPTDGVKHQVTNTGDASVADARVSCLTQAVYVEITNKVFSFISPFASDATEKTAGGGSNQIIPYALTISGVSGSGMSKVADLSLDGSVFGSSTLFDLTTGSDVSGTGIKAIGSTYPYKVVTGPLEGLVFALDAGVANSDKANILIFASRFIQIAPDASGVAGTFGTDDVPLTESGQADGVITASGVAYYWTRFLVPSAANNESNPYPANVALIASQSTSAGWEE